MWLWRSGYASARLTLQTAWELAAFSGVNPYCDGLSPLSSKQEVNRGLRRGTVDSATESDTYGVRGGGAASWQARWGMPLNEQDLLFAARREPIAKRTVVDVAHDIFSKGFTVEEVSEKPDPAWSREVSKVLDSLNARANLTRLVLYERLFGWSILALTYVDYGKNASEPVQNPREIRELMPYSSLQCTVQSSDEDKDVKSARFGLPLFYRVRRADLGASQDKIHFSRVIHCATRLLDHAWKGVPVLEVLYDDQTVLRNARWALGETLVRTAAGFADITLKGAKAKQVADFEAEQNLRQLNQRTYFVHPDNATVGWVGPAGKALNPEPYLNPIMESESCGSRIPLSHLRGANAGTLAGSETNDREYWGGIAALQKLCEPVIWELVDRLIETGQISFKYGKRRDYRVVWPAGFELTETAKATIELQLAQARNLKCNWKTVDEIRAEEDLPPLPNGEGTAVLGLQNSHNPQGQTPLKSAVAVAAEADSGGFWLLKRLRRKKA
jgi:hypothetical protein